MEKITHRIMKYYTNRFKINYSFAYIFKHVETQVLWYYRSWYNNAQMLETALFISNQIELLDFLNSLAKESFYDGSTHPDTKLKIVQIFDITFHANTLKDSPLGAGVYLPDYESNHGLTNASGGDNLCFSRCLANTGRCVSSPLVLSNVI